MQRKQGKSTRPSLHELDKGDSLDLGLPKQWLDRDEALATFFTPRQEYSESQLAQEALFGADGMRFAMIRPRSSFVAPQIRKHYDRSRIERIGKSIDLGEDGQLQNGAVSFLDADHISAYLSHMNDYFSSQVSIEELVFHEKFGFYIITCFGHNRQFAIASANQNRYGHPDVGLSYFVKVFINPSFSRVLGNQAIENIGEPPHIAERARSMVKYAEYMRHEARPVSIEDVAQKFGVDRDQVWRADKFMSLPDVIKGYIEDDEMPYSGGIELSRLVTLYGEEYTINLANRLVQKKASTPQIIQEVRKRETATVLTPGIRHLIEEDGLTLAQAIELAKLVKVVKDDELDELALVCSSQRLSIDEIRHQVDALLAQKLSGAMTFFDQDGLPPEQAEYIEQLRTAHIESSTKAALQATMTEITKSISALRAIYTAGLVGRAANGRPISRGAPEYLGEIVDTMLDDDGSLDQRAIEKVIALIEDMKANASMSLEFTKRFDFVMSRLDELLSIASSETSETQLKRRQILQNVRANLVSSVQPDQDSLF